MAPQQLKFFPDKRKKEILTEKDKLLKKSINKGKNYSILF